MYNTQSTSFNYTTNTNSTNSSCYISSANSTYSSSLLPPTAPPTPPVKSPQPATPTLPVLDLSFTHFNPSSLIQVRKKEKEKASKHKPYENTAKKVAPAKQACVVHSPSKTGNSAIYFTHELLTIHWISSRRK
jgi:hypothetical protein